MGDFMGLLYGAYYTSQSYKNNFVMLWFSHRVANCFIVSIYYLAIAPSQTIALSHCYLVQL